MTLRSYQQAALEALLDTDSECRALIMPTGSGKTRVALRYAQTRIDDGHTVAYITESDALAQQVVKEADEIGVNAVWIPGATSNTAPPEVLELRTPNLEDYDAGLLLGVFTYASYFLGRGVPRAHTLIIDDAHALDNSHFSQSVVEIGVNQLPGPHRRLLALLREGNPSISRQFDELDIPVHRGGSAILIPPPESSNVRDNIHEITDAAAEGVGYARFNLRNQLAASRPHFISWPCVVTSDSIVWRPFIVPFESLGQPPGNPIPDQEFLLLTATRGPPDFLQTRLGLPLITTEVPLPEEIPEMGTRLLLPFEKFRSASPPSEIQAGIIQDCSIRFGAIVVTVISNQSEIRIRQLLGDAINILRYANRESLDEFRNLQEPKILILVNRPVGIDLPQDICRVALHLDLPHSTSGHEVVAGDVERLGTVAQASLGVRLSQLLGRLNRGPDDRSVHFLMDGPLPLRRGSTFTQSLDPSVLLDLLIGQRGIIRNHPNITPELLDHVEEFLNGDDTIREEHRGTQETTRERVLTDERSAFHPNANTIIEANLLLARGNFNEALERFRRLATDASNSESQPHAAFYEYQQASLGPVLGPGEERFGPGGYESLFRSALQRNPGSPHLVAALNQAIQNAAGEEITAPLVQTELQLQRQGFGFYERWMIEKEDEIPPEDQRTDPRRWKEYWREKLAVADHNGLLQSWTAGFQLLGSNTPEYETSQNDARITWSDYPHRQSLALEVKGRQTLDGGESTELTVDDVDQAFDNAQRIDADHVCIATSKARRDRLVPQAARDRGVKIILEESATAMADLLAIQCAKLHEVYLMRRSVDEIPYNMMTTRHLLEAHDDLINSIAIRRLIEPT